MNKNKKIYIVLMLAMGFFMTSCSNFLEIQPTGKVIPNTLEEYRALMTEVYANSLTDRSVCDMRTEDIIVKTPLKAKLTSEKSRNGLMIILLVAMNLDGQHIMKTSITPMLS